MSGHLYAGIIRMDSKWKGEEERKENESENELRVDIYVWMGTSRPHHDASVHVLDYYFIILSPARLYEANHSYKRLW